MEINDTVADKEKEEEINLYKKQKYWGGGK